MAQAAKPDLLHNTDNHTVWLMDRIWKRLNEKNEHFMGVVVGQEGSGKSYTALRIAESVDPSFNADRVIFDIGELLEILENGEHQPGQFYVLDEAGVQLGRRTWQDRGQILANQALQLIRSHNLGLLFTLPRLGELDSQAQGRLQAFLELNEKEDGEYVRGKWKWMDPDRADETGTIYKKYPRRRINGSVTRITSVAFSPPSEETSEPYEERKREHQTEFYEETISELSGEDEDDEGDGADTVPEIAERVKSDGVEAVQSKHGNTGELYVDADLIRANYGTSHADARAVKKVLEKEVEDE